MRFNKRRAAVLLVSSFLFIPSVQGSDRQILVYKKKYIMGTVFEIAAY